MIPALVYLLVMCAWVYVLLNRSDAAADEPWLLIAYAVLGVFHVVIGWWARSWWTPALALVAIFAAMPAGHVPDGRPEFAIWVGLLLLSPFMVMLLAAGVVARRVAERREPARA